MVNSAPLLLFLCAKRIFRVNAHKSRASLVFLYADSAVWAKLYRVVLTLNEQVGIDIMEQNRRAPSSGIALMLQGLLRPNVRLHHGFSPSSAP
jgi:hypothetical protein